MEPLSSHTGARESGLFHTDITLSSISVVDEKHDPAEELRRLYPPILTTAHVAEMLHCTIGDVRDKVHARKLPAMRWGQQFRFFRDEVLEAMRRVDELDDGDEDSEEPGVL